MIKKVFIKIKFINKIIFPSFKFFSRQIIFSLLNNPFHDNIDILESKMIYYYFFIQNRKKFGEFYLKDVERKERSAMSTYFGALWKHASEAKRPDIFYSSSSGVDFIRIQIKKICQLREHILIARFARKFERT